MKLNGKQITMMNWSVFRDNLGEDYSKVNNRLKMAEDMVLESATEGNGGNLYFRKLRDGKETFIHLQLGIKFVNNKLTEVDSIEFLEDDSVKLGEVISTQTFDSCDIIPAWDKAFH